MTRTRRRITETDGSSRVLGLFLQTRLVVPHEIIMIIKLIGRLSGIVEATTTGDAAKDALSLVSMNAAKLGGEAQRATHDPSADYLAFFHAVFQTLHDSHPSVGVERSIAHTGSYLLYVKNGSAIH